MIYRFLKILIGIGLKLYYKEIHVSNIKGLNHIGPRIIIANHPHTLMDGWILGSAFKKPIYFMAKGTFFNTKLKSLFLKSLGLIPINRAIEQKTKGVDNANSFEACYQLLEEGKTLIIFPEGNSFSERILRELKSGAARIALESERRNNGELDLKVIPIGLTYIQAEKFRSSVLVNVGEPITPASYLKDYIEHQQKTSKELTVQFRAGLEKLLVGSISSDHEEFVDEIVELLSSKYNKSDEKGVKRDMSLFKKMYSNINAIRINDHAKYLEITVLFNRIKLQLHRLDIKTDFLDRNYKHFAFIRQLIFSIVYLIIGFPFFIIGSAHNIIPFKLTDFVIPKMVKEMEYFAPIALLIGLVLYPLNYFGILFLMEQFINLSFGVKFVYFFLMPTFGLFSYYFYYYIMHISLKANFIYLMRNQKEKVKLIKKDRELLRDLIFNGNNSI